MTSDQALQVIGELQEVILIGKVLVLAAWVVFGGIVFLAYRAGRTVS